MTTSGTALFSLAIDDILEEAFERVGILQPTGNDMRSGKRSLNLLLLDLSNRGELLWSTESYAATVAADTATVTLPADTLAITTGTLRSSGSTDAEISLTPITSEDYRLYPNKTQAGRPVAYVFNRERDAGTLTLWPVPDVAYDLVFERRRRLQDVTQYTETLDVAPRFVPAIISGLAWNLADKRPGLVDQNRRGELQLRWESEIERALSEDRERVSLVLIPDFGT